jgi:hypothetical protein
VILYPGWWKADAGSRLPLASAVQTDQINFYEP